MLGRLNIMRPERAAFALVVFGICTATTLKADVADGEAAIEKLRHLKSELEAQIVALEDVEDHITQLARFYQTDPAGAFGARLPIHECTARAGVEFCEALWPFYQSEKDLARGSLSQVGEGSR